MAEVVTINTKPQALIPRMPGSKRRHLPEWAPILSQGFDTVVEYFGGGLWVTHALLQAERPAIKRVIVAEAAADLRAIYRLWRDARGRESMLRHLRRWQSVMIDKAWEEIKAVYEDAQENGFETDLAAAAGLALRILTMSGWVRDTPGSTCLNVSWNKSQLKRWQPICRLKTKTITTGYTPVFPRAIEDLTVVDCYSKIQLPDDCSNALAICDPPYCGRLGSETRRSGHYISPSYFRHRPHEQFTATMAISPVDQALSRSCHTVIACNYDAQWLDLCYRGMAMRYGYSCDRVIRGTLSGANNNVKPAQRENPYKDTYWVFQKIGEKVLELAA